jgi:hypothetical protein
MGQTLERRWRRVTLNNFMESVAANILAVYPDKSVFVGEIPAENSGNIFVGLIETSQTHHLNRRYERHLSFEVLYFLASKDTVSFHEWAESMYDAFDTLTVADANDPDKTYLVHTQDTEARPGNDNRVYQFLFDVDVYFLVEGEPIPTMYTLTQNNTIKTEVRE